MKKLYYIILIVILGSCGGAETKVHPEVNNDSTNIKPDTSIVKDNTARPADEKIPGREKSPGAKTNNEHPSANEILANIDQYLVSKINLPAPPASGGINNASITIQNTLTDISFQKAIVEVSILLADGTEFRADYYVLQNVEPGDLKTIRIPNAVRGNSISSHVVKLKSDQLTNGEMILVGDHFVAK